MSTVTLHIHTTKFKWEKGFCQVRIYLRDQGEWLLAHVPEMGFCKVNIYLRYKGEWLSAYVPEIVCYAKGSPIDDAAIAHVKESLRSQGFILNDNVELSTTRQMVSKDRIVHHTEIYRIIAS